jgi:hypothetical protein
MTDMLMVLMASFLGLMLIGLPVAWSMIAAMLVWIIYGGKWMFLPIVAERIYQGMDVFVLMVIALIILTGLPIGALMAATLIPGLLVGAAQMVQARVHDFPRVDMERTPPVIMRAAGHAAVPLMIPIVILAGLLGAFMTPTEAGGVAAAYALLVSVFLYRSINLKALDEVFSRSAMFSGQLLIILGCGADPNDAGVQHCAVDPWHVH